MAQTKPAFDEVKIPLQKMTFSPDVPSSALGANEYNAGANVEADVRGVRSVSGEIAILPDGVPGTATFISGGFRAAQPGVTNNFYFIVATTEGYWYATNGDSTGWHDITPPFGPFATYTQATNITESWNGTVPFFNDEANPPMFWPEVEGEQWPQMIMYSNQIPVPILEINYLDPTHLRITLQTAQATAPYAAGDFIVISGTNSYFDGVFEVSAATTSTIDYIAVSAASSVTGGQVGPKYTWNYNPNWKSVYAKFVRLYNTPNVGCILVAGGLTATNLDDTVTLQPTTITWSQRFNLNEAPLTWEPTVTNVSDIIDVPLRGPVLDAFPSNGLLFLQSYWDTVVLSPLNFSTTTTPILGVKLVNQGRGMLSSNCWANTDKFVYGVDARDIWVFDGQNFTGLGNQRVKNWFYNQLDPLYVDRVFMQTNTHKNQVEIYYPTTDATNGVPNKMISYRYDIDCWNPPRDVNSATFACESPEWTASPNLEWNNVGSTAVTGVGTGARFNINQQGSAYKAYAIQGDIVAAGSGYVVGNQVKILGTALGGATPANDCFMVVTGVNGSGGITDIDTPTGVANGAWIYNDGSRNVVYARGDNLKRLVQKDMGFSFISDINGQILPIASEFRRDNITLLKDYSGKLMVHRLLPEVYNLNAAGLTIDPATETNRIGSVDVRVEGANSVGQAPVTTVAVSIPTNTDQPWAQINQNAHRVNTLSISDSSTTTSWICTSTTWQFTQTEADR
jgi:hypothetical protein